jgi:hypothetical protein
MVGMVTMVLDGQSGVKILAQERHVREARYCLLLQIVQTGSEIQPVSYSVGTWVLPKW